MGRLMFGPAILARTLSEPAPIGPLKVRWQYHSRSDRHSKVACWGILFDLLRHSPLLAQQVRDGRIAFGINHEMRDFRMNRRKNLDLVLCTPRTEGGSPKRKRLSFRSLIEQYAIILAPEEEAELQRLPDIVAAEVGAVHVALEAKAAMTEHSKARPRLYDELNSSHLTVHGAAEFAIAVGFAMVNVATTFVSPGRAEPSHHIQPKAAEGIISKVMELPRRTNVQGDGYDAFAILVVDCENDGRKPVTIVTAPPAPQPGDIYHYDSMIQRLAALYEARFPRA